MIIALWALSALAATYVSETHLTPGAHDYMRAFWSDGFWPLSLRHPSSMTWPAVHLALLIGSQLGIPTSLGLACALLAAAGVFARWKEEWRTSLILAMPLVVTLGASAAGLYPLAERLALFLIPLLLLLAAIGVTEIAALVQPARGRPVALAAATLFVLVVSALALHKAPPVYRREEITPALAYLRRASRANGRELRLLRRGAGVRLLRRARCAPLARHEGRMPSGRSAGVSYGAQCISGKGARVAAVRARASKARRARDDAAISRCDRHRARQPGGERARHQWGVDVRQALPLRSFPGAAECRGRGAGVEWRGVSRRSTLACAARHRASSGCDSRSHDSVL